ncbi:MAG: hypothetical protein GYB66_15725 [Chloroflexi bacterium]|nr:hypothetical protein [Chloroflexota bacterium]
MVSDEARYQENGFQVAIYHNRKPDPYVRCETTDQPMHHVASIFDEWAEGQSLLIHYHYCKSTGQITQQIIRESPEGRSTQKTTFEQPPHELLVELLATARQQNGRTVTLMTINRRWWAPNRYPLFVGEQIEAGESAASLAEKIMGDEPSLDMMPMPRYSPPVSRDWNPFTSRRVSTQPATSNSEGKTPPDEAPSAAATENTEASPDDAERPG